MIPESLTRYFRQYKVSEAEQAKFIKEFQSTGYLKIGGSAWGEPKPQPTPTTEPDVGVKVNVNVNVDESAKKKK